MRGLGGLVELLWHELEVKLGVYNVKVQLAASLSLHITHCSVDTPDPQFILARTMIYIPDYGVHSGNY